MTHVHYKFSSKLSYDTVVFDGPYITLRDLKRQIMGREKLRSGDCDLQIINAQTQEEYTDDEGQIHKGSSVIVRRIPIIRPKSSSSSKTHNVERSDIQLHHTSGAVKAMDDQSSSRATRLFSKMANLADADVPEEDKLKVILNQCTFDSMNYNKKSGAVLPANYTCYRCGLAGHHIRNCPTSGQDKSSEAPLRLKKSTGIPRSFMVEVDDPNIKGVMMTNCGHYAIPAIHAKAYAISKKEKPPFEEQPPTSEDKEDPVPDELLCLICHDLLSDAVVIPCCGNSYCDDCIRTTLLDSEEHVCPTCSQSDVSPDTLIANKFLRQAVNTFKKERGHSKSLRGGSGTSQSQNPTPTPSPVPAPPPRTVQSQPPKPYQSARSQQDPLVHCSQAADRPLSPQVCGAPFTAVGATPASSTPSSSLQPAQSHLQLFDKEPEEKTEDHSSAAAPSVLVSHKDPAAAAPQLIPVVNHSPPVEQPQTVSSSQNLQLASSGPATTHSGPSTCWTSSSSSGCPTGGWSESNTLQPPPSSASSSYPAAPPPLFPSPHFHTFLSAQQPLSFYPPGYPPATPVWTFPPPQSAPIPSLCSSTSAALIPKEWYLHQRKKEKSPHRGSAYRRSSSRSNSKSSKSKSSRSYSRSSSRSRSRSRSRSQGRSRPHSPYARHRDLHTRSHSSYSYGYKRSPTPSSSSSPRVGYRSRSKSPSGRRKNSNHGRHRNKKSTSSSCSSKKREGCSQSEAGGSGGSADSYLYAQHANESSSLELDRERYLKWKGEYKEWCEKYFNSYVSHFHHLPPPLLGLPPSPLPQWGHKEGSRNHSKANSEFCNQLQGRRTARMDGRSPPSQSSSDSRSPPSQSSSDSRSTPSQSSSDSRSSPSHSSSDSRSPPSQSSSDGRCTQFEDGAQLTGYQRRLAEKNSRLPITLTKASKEAEVQERRQDDKQLITKTSKKPSTLKHEQKSVKKHEEGKEQSSSPDAADSADDCRKDRRRHNTAPDACKDKTTASEALESVQPLVKPDKHLDKDNKRKSGEQRNLEKERGWRRGKHSDSRQDAERRHKDKPSKGAGRVDTDRYRSPGGSKASDSRSEKDRKRKGEDVERSSVKAQSSKCLKTKLTEVPETHKSESPSPFERKKAKTEKKTKPLTEIDIWEEGIKVKPQKKISININLDGKWTEEKTKKQEFSYLESIMGKTKEESEQAGNGEEEKLNRGGTGVDGNEKNKPSRDQKGVSEEKIKPGEGEARPIWEKVLSKDDKREMKEKRGGKKEGREEEDFDLWHCALSGVEEEKEDGKKQWEERHRMEASKEEVRNDKRRSVTAGKEEERRVRNDSRGQGMGELDAGSQKEMPEGESTCKENIENQPEELKPEEELMEWRMRREEDTVRFKAEGSRNESLHDEPNTTGEDGSSYEGHREKKMVVRSLEEYSRSRAACGEDELILIQVPRSKWEKEEFEEEEQDGGQIKVKTDSLAAFLPSSSVSVTAETPTGNEEQRPRDIERDGARAMTRGKDSSQRSVAPSSGKDRPDSTSSTERNRERRMEMERPRGRERESERPRDRERESERPRDRERESERPRDRQKESKRSKERTRDREERREKDREGRHSSNGSVQNRNPPSSSHSYSYSTSHDTERRDRQRGDDQGSNKSSCSPGGKSSSGRSWESSSIHRAAELPNKTCGDTLLDSKSADRYHSHNYHNPQDPSGNYRHQDGPLGTHQSPPSFSRGWGKERDLPPSESSGGSELSKPRMSSPTWELRRSRNDRKVEKGEWKQNKVDKAIKEGKGERENQEVVAERDGGCRWEDGADKLDGQTRWEGGRELEEGQRPSSNSVSESSGDERRKEWKQKQKKHKKEKRPPAPELLEEGELRKHTAKKSRKSRDGSEEESSGEEEDHKWKEDHAKLCSAPLF